jgi:hypothetical protein
VFYLLPILVLLVPVMAVVFLALRFDRKLAGSCGGVGADGRCTKCGRESSEMPEWARRANFGSPANFQGDSGRS